LRLEHSGFTNPHPFDPLRLIGTLIEVGPTSARLNLPKATENDGQWLYGRPSESGIVGDFVVIESGDDALFGRIVSVKLPERDRLSVEENLSRGAEAHPVGTVQLLASVGLSTGKIESGVSRYPRLGSRVFSTHPELVKWLTEVCQHTPENPNPIVLEFASLPFGSGTAVGITPERLFGRHCAVLGATGGGKSWTVARLLQECTKHHSKIILIDATGEYQTLSDKTVHLQIGTGKPEPDKCVEVALPCRESLREEDLYIIAQPSGGIQYPRLRSAIKSLKLVELLGKTHAFVNNGLLVKANKNKQPIEEAFVAHAAQLENTLLNFDVQKLSLQIQSECIHPNGFLPRPATGPDPSKYGDTNSADVSNCIGLVIRIENAVSSSELKCIFRPGDLKSVTKEIDSFLKDSGTPLLRISLKYLPSSFNAPEIVANALGRYLLGEAKTGRFKDLPLIVFVDEAHRFLNKAMGDEQNRYPLDSFELIAKEGRKYGLSICIATQRPRDIPQGILSQMGTLIVHRLVNDADREVVERASGDIDRSAAAFLPSLVPGEAVVIGADFVIPLVISVNEPACKPVSHGPDFQKYWKEIGEAKQPIVRKTVPRSVTRAESATKSE
jgi:hypothetical protein